MTEANKKEVVFRAIITVIEENDLTFSEAYEVLDGLTKNMYRVAFEGKFSSALVDSTN